MIPGWLHLVSMLSVGAGVLCSVVIVTDLWRHPQHMGIMNVVWPVTALFGSAWVLWQYFTYGRPAEDSAAHAMDWGGNTPNAGGVPFFIAVGNGALHCGSGCTLGDILAEWLAFFFPGVAVWFGWHTLFDAKMFAVWLLDFVLAFAFGIVFRYFSIAPMRGLSFRDGIVAAIKADTLSLTAWQAGMYGFMAIAAFGIFRAGLGIVLRTDMVEFWFMMQIAMLCGFATAYPVNWWLIRTGMKERM